MHKQLSSKRPKAFESMPSLLSHIVTGNEPRVYGYDARITWT